MQTIPSRSFLMLSRRASATFVPKIHLLRTSSSRNRLFTQSSLRFVPPHVTSHEKLDQPYPTANFIDNKFVVSDTDEWIDLHDPATNHLLTRVPQSTDAELRAAVASATAAFPQWKATSILKRQQILFKFTALIRENWDRLAASITLEQGKTFQDAKGDVLRGLQVAETACGITTQMIGEVLPVAKDMETRSYRERLGVVAAICPFNFPAMIPLWSIPIATVIGNCLLLKPSERDPGAALILAELVTDLGPVVSPESKARIENLIASAEEEGATIFLDGRNFAPKDYPNGNSIRPTIITNIKPHMKCYQEEIFGPVLLCLESESLDDAIALVNKNEYGNGVAIFTNSGSTASYFQQHIEAGQVGINVPIHVSTECR